MDSNSLEKNVPQNDGFPPVASTSDFTGLIPAGLDSDQELEAYNEMYAYIPPADSCRKSFKNIPK